VVWEGSGDDPPPPISIPAGVSDRADLR